MSIPRRCVIAMSVVFGAIALCGCSDTETEDEAPHASVVLYSSVDDELLREVVSAFEQESGIRVDLVGDTEATKTTGLVMRLIAERDRPKADVWWSSEAFGTIHLAEQGVLEPYSSTSGEAEFVGEWPERLRDSDDRWYAFAQRARVIAYSTSRVRPDDAPASLAELTDPAWKGRVGIARPAFGTTRGHLGALMDQWGRSAFKRWCEAMRDNDIRIYDGNASVVRGIAQGEIDVGLTDTDDVWSAQRNNWEVGLVYETPDPHTGNGLWPSHGAMVVPNTCALIRGAPHPDQARRLINFLISARTEARIAQSASRNVPVTPVAREMHPELEIPGAWTPDLERAARAIPEALEIWDEVFGP
jgi:iron(III) transport system substrate-binding protein